MVEIDGRGEVLTDHGTGRFDDTEGLRSLSPPPPPSGVSVDDDARGRPGGPPAAAAAALGESAVAVTTETDGAGGWAGEIGAVLPSAAMSGSPCSLGSVANADPATLLPATTTADAGAAVGLDGDELLGELVPITSLGGAWN